MIDIPCQMTFNLDFESEIPTKKILDKILDTILNISTRPHLNINAKIVNLDLFNFIMKLKENFVLKLTILNPKPTELLDILSKNFELNFKITNKDYDFSSIRYEFNLILEVENNISNFIKKNDNEKIKKIIINHNKNIDYKTFKKEITLIADNKNISKKLYLTPYLEENEQENFIIAKNK